MAMAYARMLKATLEGRDAKEGQNVGGRARLAANAGVGVHHRFVESSSLHRPRSSVTANLRQSAYVNSDDRYRCQCTNQNTTLVFIEKPSKLMMLLI